MSLGSFRWHSLQTRVILFTVGVFVVGTWALALYSGRILRQNMQTLVGEQQFSTVSYVASKINEQIVSRLDALHSLAADIAPIATSKTAFWQTELEQQHGLQHLFNAGTMVVDANGTAVASLPLSANRLGVNYMERDVIVAALKEGKATVGRPIIGKKLQVPLIAMAVPIKNAQGKVTGAVVGVINLRLSNFLDQLADSHYGKTGDYLLVAPQHRLKVTSSDKTHIMQPVDAPGSNAMMDQYMQGYQGFGTAVNAHGQLELSAAKAIPVTGWFVVATLPAAEAFSPVDALFKRLLLGTLLFTLLVSALTWWVLGQLLQRQLAPMLLATRALASQTHTDQPLQNLPHSGADDEIGELIAGFNRLLATASQREQALLASEAFKDSVLNAMPAEIAVLDRHGIIRAVNNRWLDFSLANGFDAGKPAPNTGIGTNYLAVCEASAAPGSDANGFDACRGIRAVLEGSLPHFELEYPCDSPQQKRWFSMIVTSLGRQADHGAVVVHTEITERKQAEEVDHFLSQAGIDGKEPFFDALARFLATSLQMNYVCIDRLVGDELNATTLAIWHDGVFDDNVTYALKDTPCGDVVTQRVCCFPASVCRLFPNDAALLELQAESYIGTTLVGQTGQTIGLIAVIGRHELTNRAQAQSTLERIAPRAAAELERLTIEAALREREAQFRTVVDVIPDAIAVHRAGKLAFVNPAAVRIFGAHSEQDLIGKPILELIHPDFHQIVLNRVKSAVEHGENSSPMEERYVRLDGSMFDAEVQGRPIVLEGKPAVLVTLKDITESKLAQEQLQLAASVFSHAREGIMITEPDGTIIDVNGAFTRITGYARHEALGRNPRFMSSGRHDAQFYAAMWRSLTEQGYWYGEIWNRRKNGELFAEMQAISAVRDASGAVRHYVSLFSDITAMKEQQSRLEHIAHFDPLTNLPNRVLLADRLKQGMAQAQRRSQQLAVAYLDLDGFKNINDHHGHDVGDQVLVALASRMNQTLREGDTLARIGGDEFVAVLIDLEDASASVPMLRRLLESAAMPVRVGELTLQVTSSLGVAFFPQDREMDADQLLRQADQTMYQAKLAGKNRYHIFDAARDSSLRVHNEGIESIRQGMERQEFVLHYQPKVNMRSGKVIGTEALIRWQHPKLGLLAPAAFLPTIEDHPLAVTLGEWVIDQALAQLTQWHLAGLVLPVSVNVGARQIQQSDFVDRLTALLARHPKVKPSSLELEILETSALEDIAKVSQVIEDCAQMGVMFALDDFGTGYSSLTYLKRLRVNMLKIDQSFVCDMLQDPDDLAILRGVIGLAEAFRREVIAEGVESVAHGTLLLQLGCELAQGHGIAHPMPAQDMQTWVAHWQPDPAWSQAAQLHTA